MERRKRAMLSKEGEKCGLEESVAKQKELVLWLKEGTRCSSKKTAC
jgi:hypothetical protein